MRSVSSVQAEREEEQKRRAAKLQQKRAAKRPEEPAASDHKQASAGPCLTTARVLASAAFLFGCKQAQGAHAC